MAPGTAPTKVSRGQRDRSRPAPSEWDSAAAFGTMTARSQRNRDELALKKSNPDSKLGEVGAAGLVADMVPDLRTDLGREQFPATV